MPGQWSFTSFAISFALAACALASAPGCARAQANDPLFTATRQQLDVVKIVLAQRDAWNEGKLDAYLSHYKNAPDTQAVLATLVRGVDNIRAAYRLNFPNKESMGSIEDSEVEVRALGPDFALATGKYHLTRSRKAGGDADGVFTELFEKGPAGWQIILSEST
jgi:ketosteroid isomerase-like protein